MKMIGFHQVPSIINHKVISILQSKGKSIVTDYLQDNLDKGKEADGDKMPAKTDTTKKQYAEHGWDTKHWLVRTGRSTHLIVTNISGGFSVRPADPDKVLQFIKEAREWFTLNKTVSDEIVNSIKKDLK